MKHCNQPSLAEQRGEPEIKVNLLTGGKIADERVKRVRDHDCEEGRDIVCFPVLVAAVMAAWHWEGFCDHIS